MRTNKVMGIIFSDMHDSSLGELTDRRTTGSVPYGGRYRLIDFALSGMVNADIQDIGVITKTNYQSLLDHVGAGRAWDLARKRGGLTIIPPFASQISGGIYRGRLEALSGALSFIRHNDAKYVLVSDCDMISNFDVKEVINQHIQSGAQITMLYKTMDVPADLNRQISVVSVDEETNDITDVKAHVDVKGEHNVFMNTFLIEKQLLERMVSDAISRSHYSLIRHAIQPVLGRVMIKGYAIPGYAKLIGGMQSYFRVNMDLLDADVRKALFPPERPVLTKVRDQVPVKYGLAAKVTNSFIADGCVLDGAVENCVIFRGVKVGKGSVLRNCVIMQDTYIGENCSLSYVITDKNVLVKDSRTLISSETYPIYVGKGNVI